MIKLAKNLELPLEAVTQTFAVLAKRGAGKSFTADVLGEELLGAGQQVVILDPTGAHWGLRSSADGKAAGFPIVVIGGDHADVPLDEHAGETIAEALTLNRFPAIIDLSHLRKGQTIRFATAFLETLYRRNRESLHLIVDEADTFAPQRLLGEEARMCGAMEDVVKKGRIRGIGCTLITQRPAVLNKNVLTQCESLFAMRLTHPKDIAAIREWVAVHASPEEERQVVAELPSLPIGTAWFWSPGWLGMLKRVAIRLKQTFDSGATPKPGQKRITPKALAAIDIDALGEKIKAAADKAKADDPRELRKLIAEGQRKIADLEKQLAQRPAETVRVEVPVISDENVARLEKLVSALSNFTGDITLCRDEIRGGLEKLVTSNKNGRSGYTSGQIGHGNGRNGYIPPQKSNNPPRSEPRIKHAISDKTAQNHRENGRAAGTDNRLSGRQQNFLDAAATLATLGVEVSRETVSAWVGVHPRGGSVGETLKALEDLGLITLDRGQITVTDAGVDAAGQIDPSEAIDRAKGSLSPRQAKFFESIAAVWPGEISREGIAEQFDLHPRGGSLGEDLGRLVGRGLVENNRGRYRCRDFLFAGT